MRSILTRFLLVVACFTSAFTVGTLTHSSAASATVRPAHSASWYDSATCTAFASWERHPTAARFARMAGYARHADPFLRADTTQWERDAKRHAPRPVLAVDRFNVWADCALTPDQAASQ